MGAPRHITRALALLALATLVVAVAAASPSVALVLAPALLLFGALVVGVFPGEEALARARSRRQRRRVRAPRRIARPVLARLVRPAGRTFAFALAMRPPPVALAHR